MGVMSKTILKKFALIRQPDTWPAIKKCNVLLVCGDQDRSYLHENQRYSPIIDSINDDLVAKGYVVCSISDRISSYAGSEAYNNPYSVNRSLIKYRALTQIGRMIGLSQNSLEHYRVKKETALWRNILNKCEPTVVIGIQPDHPLCIAANELKIRVYDVQHGLISDTDDNDYYWSTRLNLFDRSYLPTGFLCWSDVSSKILGEINALKHCDIKTVGNPWFRRFINVSPTDRLARKALSSVPCLDRFKPSILVSLQNNIQEYAGDYVTDGFMADCLKSVIMNNAENYNWLIRLHPAQLVGDNRNSVLRYLDELFGRLEHVHWQWCTSLPLPVVLSLTNLHLTHFSSTTVEAGWMGIHTGLLDPHIRPSGKHQDFYTHERETGVATVVPLSEEKLSRFIQEKLQKRTAIEDQDHLFRVDSLEEIISRC